MTGRPNVSQGLPLGQLHELVLRTCGVGRVYSRQLHEAGILEFDMMRLVDAGLARIDEVNVERNYAAYFVFF